MVSWVISLEIAFEFVKFLFPLASGLIIFDDFDESNVKSSYLLYETLRCKKRASGESGSELGCRDLNGPFSPFMFELDI
jgi:hypothetical protein